MTAEHLGAMLPILLVGASIWVTPALTRPTLQFGVRVPGDRVDAAVIQQERHRYAWRTGVLCGCFAGAAALLTVGSGWLVGAILLLQLATGFGCFLLARERISAVKAEQGWFEGLTQTVAADTTWRTDPERFPVLWLAPAVAVLIATTIIGAVRYPSLPDRIAVHFSASGVPERWVDTSVWSAFSLVITQLMITVLIAGLLVLTYRSRADVDAADAVGTTGRYRIFLARMGRAVLALAALVNVSMLLVSLQVWQVYRLTGLAAAVPVVPTALGVLVLLVLAVRMGQAGSRLPASAQSPDRAGVVNRDDDRFWKAGWIYVNRDDPALLVGKRFGVGWTLNFGNPRAVLLLVAIIAIAVVPLAVKAQR